VCYAEKKAGVEMNLSNLQYFLAVVETGTISQAARKNYMSQQALSDRIRRLEKHYRLPLLERTNPVRLTPAGELVCRTAREVLGTMEQLDRQLAELEKKAEGRLVISTGQSGTPPFLPKLMLQFQERMPEVEPLLIHPSSLEAELIEVPLEADLLVGNLPFGENMETVELFRDPICVAISEKLLEKQLGSAWRDREPELLARGAVRDWGEFPLRTAKSNGHKKIEAVCNTGNVGACSPELLLHLCLTGQCAAVIPMHFARCIFDGAPQMRSYPLFNEDILYQVAIGTRRGEPLGRAAEVFIRTAVEYFQKNTAEGSEGL